MELFDVYPLFDIQPVKGEGSYVFDEKGTKYLDFYGGHAVISIGHSHPLYVKRIQEQVSQLGFYSNSVINPLQNELARRLGKISGYDQYRLFLCNSGAEANENAMKLAAFKTGKTDFIAFKKSFHGRTSAAVNVTDNLSIQSPINQSIRVEYHDINDPESVIGRLETGSFCGVILEPIQGIGGMNVFSKQSLQSLSEACQSTGTVLIMDEIQSGYARSGNFFAHQWAGIRPDLITVAKGMGNGFPIGGVLIHPDFEASHGLLGTTFGGNHLACAAGLAVLEVIEQDDLQTHARLKGLQLVDELLGLPGLIKIKGRGLMLGLEFEYPVARLRKELVFRHQVFTGSASNPNMIRLLPALNITDTEIDLFIKAIKEVTKSVKVADI